jgi:hypothetical protein
VVSGQSSWLQNGDVMCFLWGTNWIYICYIEESRPPLWSSGQSSWLQIQRSPAALYTQKSFGTHYFVDEEETPITLQPWVRIPNTQFCWNPEVKHVNWQADGNKLPIMHSFQRFVGKAHVGSQYLQRVQQVMESIQQSVCPTSRNRNGCSCALSFFPEGAELVCQLNLDLERCGK